MDEIHHGGFENLTNIISAIMAPSNDSDLETLGTPENCVADFCLIPVFLQLRLQVTKSDRVVDRNPYGISVPRGRRRSTFDAEEQFDVFNAFRRDHCG